jgi:DNA-binding response OmpR family regulator
MSRVLVIDDDGAFRSDVAEQLQSWGYETKQAPDGRAGLQVIFDWSPDVVLSDIEMPQMTGFDLIKAVSQSGLEYASVGFFFMTTLQTRQNVLSGLHAGADDYLVKPIDYGILESRLNSFLRKRNIITEKNAVDNAIVSVERSAISAAAFTAVGTVTGIIGLLILYLLKSVLGFDLMPDAHFLDLFIDRS